MKAIDCGDDSIIVEKLKEEVGRAQQRQNVPDPTAAPSALRS